MDDLIPVYECKVHLKDGHTFDVQVDEVGIRLLLTHDKVSTIEISYFKYLPK